MWSLLLFSVVTLCSFGLGKSENTTQGCQMAKLDLVIIVDSSASVGSQNFKEIVKFIQDLVKPLPVHSEGIRVALVRYSSDANVITYLDDAMNKQEKSAALGSMKYRPGSTRTDLAIAKTRNEVLIPERGDRPDVPDQVILLTDGTSTNKTATRDETRLLKKRSGLKIIVLGIGNQLDDTELLEIATSAELKHVVTNFSHLSGMLKDLESATCEDRTKSVTPVPLREVLTSPGTEDVVQLKNSISLPSVENSYLLHISSSSKESIPSSEPSLIQEFVTENSKAKSYRIPQPEDGSLYSDFITYLSGQLPDLFSSLPGTPLFHPVTTESSLFNFELASQSEVQLRVTTTVYVHDLISTSDVSPSELQLSTTSVLTSTPLSRAVVSITDPNYDVLISSVLENSSLSAHTIQPILDFDAVNSEETLNVSTPTLPLTPMLLSILTLSSDVLLQSLTSFSTFALSSTNASTSLSITPTPALPLSSKHSMPDTLSFSPAGSSTDDSISSTSPFNIMPTFTTAYTQSQSRVFNTEVSESVSFTDQSVFDNISINASSIEPGKSKTGGDISSDFVYIYVGGGIIGLVTLLATSIILARIFRSQNEDDDVAT